MSFVLAHRFEGSSDALTYYQIDGFGRLSRVSDSSTATEWQTEQEASAEIKRLGLSGDTSVFVIKK